jgi:hypothetical protein
LQRHNAQWFVFVSQLKCAQLAVALHVIQCIPLSLVCNI